MVGTSWSIFTSYAHSIWIRFVVRPLKIIMGCAAYFTCIWIDRDVWFRKEGSQRMFLLATTRSYVEGWVSAFALSRRQSKETLLSPGSLFGIGHNLFLFFQGRVFWNFTVGHPPDSKDHIDFIPIALPSALVSKYQWSGCIFWPEFCNRFWCLQVWRGLYA